MTSHCSFDLLFSNNQWCWASFHVPTGHLYVLFWRKDRSSALFFFFNWIVGISLISSCMSCLYLLEINPLPFPSFGNIFSHSELSFCLVYGFLCSAKASGFSLPTEPCRELTLSFSSDSLILWQEGFGSGWSLMTLIFPKLTFLKLGERGNDERRRNKTRQWMSEWEICQVSQYRPHRTPCSAK